MIPIKEGKKRYSEGKPGYYMANYEKGTPCTCTDKCKDPCKGNCGCEACCEAYGDFLSCE